MKDLALCCYDTAAVLLIDAGTREAALGVAPKRAAANVGEHPAFAVELRACGSFESFKS